jgi:cell fate (sporulation/competence/biofilm development) regulator YlbF (YheA/YmcA/DUF963 family)
MTVIPISLLTDRDEEIQAQLAAQALGQLLFDTSVYRVFVAASDAANEDSEAQRLSSQMSELNNALQWGQGDSVQQQAALQQLSEELENLASVQAYRRAERVTVQLFHEVDLVISQVAGVEFAANARRSSCGCGG